MSTAAPDYAEPILGWRVWRVGREHRDLRLLSVVQETVWPVREELVADCLRTHVLPRLRRRARHHAPRDKCQCGIYATDLDHLGPFLDERGWHDTPYVFGQVAMWGTVVECERGWRASCAYPSRIFVPTPRRRTTTSSEEVAFGLAPYGVPVELLPVVARDALEVVAGRRGRLGSIR